MPSEAHSLGNILLGFQKVYKNSDLRSVAEALLRGKISLTLSYFKLNFIEEE